MSTAEPLGADDRISSTSSGPVPVSTDAPGGPASEDGGPLSRGAFGERKVTGRRGLTRVVTSDVSVAQRVRGMWKDRELLVYMVGREIKVKYKNSALGIVWSLLNPALTIVVYWFVFQKVLDNKQPRFALYLMCGLVVWNFFSTAVSGACGSVVGNASLVKKVSFSREILAMTSVGSSAFFFLIQSVILVGALAIFLVAPSPSYLAVLPLALVALVIFTSALAIFFAAVNVYFRDIQHLLEVTLMAWFWGSPIVYSWSFVSRHLTLNHLTWLYNANLISPIVLLFQRALYGNPYNPTAAPGIGTKPGLPGHSYIVAQFTPEWYLAMFGITIAVSIALFGGALKLFGKLEGNFAEEL